MSTPNDRQVAGTHYEAPYQHWDFAADMQLGYFEGQITKYVYRHPKKKGREDMEKGVHFFDKLLSLDRTSAQVANPAPAPATSFTKLFAHAPWLQVEERQIIISVCLWRGKRDLELCRELLAQLVDVRYPVEAGANYVNQG